MNEQNIKTVQTIKAHISLNVRNIEKSVDFYKKMLGSSRARSAQVFVVLEDNLPEASGGELTACCDTAPANLVNIERK